MPHFRQLVFLLFLITIPQTGSAQEKTAKGRTFRIACWSEWTNDELYIRLPKKKSEVEADGNLHKIEILDMSYSTPYPYSLGKPLQFFKKTENPEEPFALVLQVAIPDSNKEPLVLLILGKQKISHMVYDLNARTFPFGSYQLVNFTTGDLLAEFAGKRFGLKPRSSKLINPSSKENKAVQCKVAMNQNGKAKVVYSSMLMNRPKKRMLMFFYPTTDEAGRPTVKCRSLVDFQPSPESASN